MSNFVDIVIDSSNMSILERRCGSKPAHIAENFQQVFHPQKNKPIAEYTLIGLIRAGLGMGLPEHPDARTETDWACVNELAAGHGIAPWLYYALKTRELLAVLPTSLWQPLSVNYLRAVAAAETRRQSVSRALQALAQEKLEPVVLKGGILSQLVYPDPACRPMGDLDVWFTASEMSRAQTALERIGYVRHDKRDRPAKMQERNLGEIQLVGPNPQAGLIELHWGVFPGEWAQRTLKLNENEIYARTVELTLEGQRVRTLAPEDTIIELAFHWAINHQLGAPWLRAVLDLVLFARAYRIDWHQVTVRAHEWHLNTVLFTVLNLVCELDPTFHPLDLESLVRSRVRRNGLKRAITLSRVVHQRNFSSRVRFIYLLGMVDRWSDLVSVLGRALAPETEWLEARYGDATWQVQLRHLWNALGGHV